MLHSMDDLVDAVSSHQAFNDHTALARSIKQHGCGGVALRPRLLMQIVVLCRESLQFAREHLHLRRKHCRGGAMLDSTRGA